MKHRILYLGDTALDRQASYLAGIMSYYQIDFDYLNSNKTYSSSYFDREYNLMIISDYPASHFSPKQIKAIAEKVKDGMGLLMIGGWESFTGDGGDYYNTDFADILPVIMDDTDDRVNFLSPCLVINEQEHKITNSLPFNDNVPAIGGLNNVIAKQDASVLLTAREYKATRNGDMVHFVQNAEYPLLITGDYGFGRTAAFTSDVAPHWVGPFVDWGDQRIKARADGGETIEVGNWYAQFFANLINWLCVKNYETANLI